MIVVNFLYPNGPGVWFDKACYHDKQIPLVLERFGDTIKGVFIGMALETPNPDASAPYIATFHVLVDSIEAFGEVLNVHGAELQSHVPDYTNATPIVQFSDVTMASLSSPVPLRPAGA